MLEIDSDLLAALGPLAAALPPEPSVGDWGSRRAGIDALYAILAAGSPPIDEIDIETTDLTTTSGDGHTVGLRLYKPKSAANALVVYLHGGGLIAGSIDGYDHVCRRYVEAAGVAMVAVDYRLAPEAPYPAALEDGIAAVKWATEHVAKHATGVRVVVMGDSAGGGLAAVAAAACRDRGIGPVAAQVLVYPMLDDRTARVSPEIEPSLTWSVGDNITGWRAYLGDVYGADVVPPLVSAARIETLDDLPSTYLEVGQLDLFCAEGVAFATRLMEHGVAVHLVVRAGAFHGFDQIGPESAAARSAFGDRTAFLRSL